jgi:NitT/TauT family transport system ATP-binding protein
MASLVTGPLKISGMAFQASSLLPWRTTLDNVLLPLEIVEPYRSQLQAKESRVRERARKLLEHRGLGRLRRQVPLATLGRHAAARQHLPRLIHEPKMLLLDEPFGALDAFTREELWCILRDLWTEQSVQRHLGHARPARIGVFGRHGVRDEQRAPAALW